MNFLYTWLQEFINEFVYLFVEMSPYLMLGFLVAGILHVFVPESSIQRYMGKRDLKSVFYAALIGIPLPLCSCGVIPTGVSLYKSGASKPASVSFLISTPQTGVDSILITYSLMGLPFAIVRPIVALIAGVLGGWLTLFATDVTKNDSFKQENKNTANLGFLQKMNEMFRYAFVDFMQDIAKWLVIGLVVAAAIAMIIPDNFFENYVGNTYLEMLLVMLAAVPLYVCATGSVPIAAVLLMKGLSPGAALVFLMAGPATNAATITVINRIFGKRTMYAYLAAIIGTAYVSGIILNEFLPFEWFAHQHSEHMGHEHHLLPAWLVYANVAALASLLLYAFYNKYFAKRKEMNISAINNSNTNNNMEKKLIVKGMTCNHCKMSVEKNLKKIDGITLVTANPETNEVVISGDNINLETIKDTVNDLGYEFVGEKN